MEIRITIIRRYWKSYSWNSFFEVLVHNNIGHSTNNFFFVGPDSNSICHISISSTFFFRMKSSECSTICIFVSFLWVMLFLFVFYVNWNISWFAKQIILSQRWTNEYTTNNRAIICPTDIVTSLMNWGLIVVVNIVGVKLFLFVW